MPPNRKRLTGTKKLLRDLGLPPAQQNERSALTLLALADLKPRDPWKSAHSQLIGVTPIMDWIRANYRRDYAPNTRETIRRQTLHQFVQAGLAAYNPDEPGRSVNSPKAVYQITAEALSVIKSYESEDYVSRLSKWLEVQPTLIETYSKLRNLELVPVTSWDGRSLALSSGKHSKLLKQVIEDFGARYVPKGRLVYVGDTAKKLRFCDEEFLTELGVKVDRHGKMPDVVLYSGERNWLFLVESVTSHGPMSAKRQHELKSLFGKTRSGVVYVSAFPDFKTFTKYSKEIAWETEVWISDAPDHLIHFDGARFLGPYQN